MRTFYREMTEEEVAELDEAELQAYSDWLTEQHKEADQIKEAIRLLETTVNRGSDIQMKALVEGLGTMHCYLLNELADHLLRHIALWRRHDGRIAKDLAEFCTERYAFEIKQQREEAAQ